MIALLAGIVLVVPQVLAAEAGYRRLPVAEFRDKMKGAWLGQRIGVGWGAPTEKGPVSGHFSTEGYIMAEARMPPWKPEMVNRHNNDDCYVEMTFLKTLETYGFDVSIRQAGLDFANSGFGLAHANRAGRRTPTASTVVIPAARAVLHSRRRPRICAARTRSWWTRSRLPGRRWSLGAGM